MPTLLISPHGTDLHTLRRFNDVPEGSVVDRWGREPRVLSPKEPYLLGSDDGRDESVYLSLLAHHAGPLCDLCQDFGGPTVVALADLVAEIQADHDGPDALSYAQAATGIYNGRRRQFQQALDRQQGALLDHYRATHGKAPKGVSPAQTREALLRSRQELNTAFRFEIDSALAHSHRRSRLYVPGRVSVPDRVRETRKVSRLDVSSLRQAGNLGRLGKISKRIAPGLLALDLGRRILHVREVRNAGGDWQREAFVESVGFAASANIGSRLTGASVLATGATAIATRSPSMTLVVGYGAVVVTPYAVDFTDEGAKAIAGLVYDKVAAFLRDRS